MTEDEAKKKWCPFSRTGIYVGTGGIAVNRHVADEPGGREGAFDETRCLGSGCMAWRLRMGNEHYGYCGLANDDGVV